MTDWKKEKITVDLYLPFLSQLSIIIDESACELKREEYEEEGLNFDRYIVGIKRFPLIVVFLI